MVPDFLGRQIRPVICHTINIRIKDKTRRLMVVTGNWPIPMIEVITEGVIGRAANAAAGRVMDGVC